jgi:hypothetical protein
MPAGCRVTARQRGNLYHLLEPFMGIATAFSLAMTRRRFYFLPVFLRFDF